MATPIFELTEKSTLGEFLEEIEVSSIVKRRLEKVFDPQNSLEYTLHHPGDIVQKRMNDETYMNVCETFMEFILIPEQYPFFSKYIPTMLAVMNDHKDLSGEFARKVNMQKNIDEYISEKSLFALLKSLHTLRQLYYHTEVGTTTVNKNFFVTTAKMYIEQYSKK